MSYYSKMKNEFQKILFYNKKRTMNNEIKERHVMEMDSTALYLLIKYMTTQPYMIFRGIPEKIQKFLDLQGQYYDRLMTKDKVLITSLMWMWSMMDMSLFKKCFVSGSAARPILGLS